MRPLQSTSPPHEQFPTTARSRFGCIESSPKAVPRVARGHRSTVPAGVSCHVVLDEATRTRLVVVSNRLPFLVAEGSGGGGEVRVERSPGGLAAAVEPALRRNGGTWVGW